MVDAEIIFKFGMSARTTDKEGGSRLGWKIQPSTSTMHETNNVNLPEKGTKRCRRQNPVLP